MRTLRTLTCTITAILAVACSAPPEDVEVNPGAITNATDDEDHPEVVALVKGDRVLCTGSLVSESSVVTAAHCFALARPTHVLLGRSLADASAELVEIRDIALHPDYDVGESAHDVAVVRLAAAVPTAPVRLPDSALFDRLTGRTIRIVGFGKSTAQDRSAARRRLGTATVEALAPTTLMYSPNPSSTCFHDSGGPAFLVSEREYLVGIASTGGTDCDGSGVYVRVDANLSFITAAARNEGPGAAPSCSLVGTDRPSSCGALVLWILAVVLRRRSRMTRPTRSR